jgi:RHS repeat-associated protein
VKYVFAGEVRIARVEGAIDPSRERLQRLRLAQGWNALTVAVASGRTLAQVFGADAAFYTWMNGNYQPLPGSRTAQPGEPLWVHAPTARVAVVKGLYQPAAANAAVPPGGAFIAWPRLEAFQPGAHLSATGRLFLHDPQAGRFLLRDPALPGFLQDLGSSLPAARALWIAAPAGTTLLPAARADQEIITYHRDHLGSSAVTTDRQGALVEELAYYPFGELRNRHAAAGSTPADYDFTGKETDDESGLVYHGARFYNPSIGRFLSVDPLYGDPGAMEAEKLEAFLSNPQKLGLYSYVLNNPLRFTDPTGLEERGMISLTREEMKADIGYFSKTDSTARETGYLGSYGTKKWATYSSAQGPVKAPPTFRGFTAWRRVPLEFHINGPDGKPVAGRLFEVKIEGRSSGGGVQGVSYYAARTDENGVIKFKANVPRLGGKISMVGFFNEGGAVKAIDDRVETNFKRKGGDYDGLKFQAQVKEQGGETAVEIKQTR